MIFRLSEVYDNHYWFKIKLKFKSKINLTLKIIIKGNFYII